MQETIEVIHDVLIFIQYLEKKLKEGNLFKKVEFVIVDDGSRDKTLELIKGYTAKYTTDK